MPTSVYVESSDGNGYRIAPKVDGSIDVNLKNPTSTVAVSNFPATQPVSGSVSVSGTVAVSSVPASSAPASSDIKGGSATATGTLFTVPAGRVFRGSASLSASISVAGNCQPSISVTGTGVVPTGVVHQIGVTGLALSVAANANTIDNLYIYGGSSGATVTFNAGASGQSAGQVVGILL